MFMYHNALRFNGGYNSDLMNFHSRMSILREFPTQYVIVLLIFRHKTVKHLLNFDWKEQFSASK